MNLYINWHRKAESNEHSYMEDFHRSDMAETARYQGAPMFHRMSDWCWFVKNGFSFQDKDTA